MMKFSSLLITTLMLGLFMLSSGLVCLLRGLELYQKEEAHNAILRFVFGCVFLVFGPVVIASLPSCGAKSAALKVFVQT
ncbi:uncharacterized protein LOC110377409 isoform X2 [Helicoverpa armigera]|uniref:uncharacterized protein LOC110377409 isoform X2 n=1 Tax=Helicoverpa armigera TaxID=29058 RepID=UPI000B38456C|nr:hypothetical protein B5X24_HaOG209167 [Helicoverpa armigera]